MTYKELFLFLFWKHQNPSGMIEIFDASATVLPEVRNSIHDTHSVLVDFYYPFEELEPLFELEDKLYELLTDPGTGMYDGHEVCLNDNEATLFFYGPDAERLFKAVKQQLDDTAFLKGAVASLRFGSDIESSSMIEVEIGTGS